MELDERAKIVTIYNPELDASTTVPLHAFEDLWQHRGWVLPTDATLRAGETLGRFVSDLDSLTVAELHQVADAQGIAYGASDTKADLLAKIDPAGQPAVTDTEYDPGIYTVADVNAHLKTVDDEEAERILEVERAGQARKGIIGEGN